MHDFEEAGIPKTVSEMLPSGAPKIQTLSQKGACRIPPPEQDGVAAPREGCVKEWLSPNQVDGSVRRDEDYYNDHRYDL